MSRQPSHAGYSTSTTKHGRRAPKVIGVGAAASLFAAFALSLPANAAQTVTDIDGSSANVLVETLVGDSTPYSNVVFTGNPLAAGTFTGMPEGLGFTEGIVLSSGFVEDYTSEEVTRSSSVLGPNDSPETTGVLSQPGDDNLSDLVSPDQTFDATVLEFDFVPSTATVTFDYVFGSDEYLEYVGEFNDVFAFFVNGVNFATFVDSDDVEQPVTINNINHLRNTDLFVNNTDGHVDTEMDGFTTVLTLVAPVNPGVTNHIKIAIADTGDANVDSSILIKAGTFRSNTPPIATDVNAGNVTQGTTVTIPLLGSDPDGDLLTYEIVSSPTATQGTVSISGSNAVFTAADDYTGPVTFTYAVSDGIATSEPATVTLNIVVAGEVTPTQSPMPTESPVSPSPTSSSQTTDGVPSTGTTGVGLYWLAASLGVLALVSFYARRKLIR